MKEIRVEEAVGQVLCHDLTQIIKGVTKGARFRKGHVIREEDIPVLLSMGKDHIFVWENDGSKLHEDEAAEILRRITQNEGMAATEPREGKIELTALHDGVFHVDEERLNKINGLGEIAIATIPQNFPVKEGTKIAGMRVIPLVIDREKMETVRSTAGEKPLLELRHYRPMKVGVVTTGTEVFEGRIKDTFTPVIEGKLKAFGLKMDEHRLSDDVMEHTKEKIEELLNLGMDMVICTGGMSVDPDDRTPAAIRAAASRVVTYGVPVLPGAMFLLAYYEKERRRVPVIGLPGCVMYSAVTIFDIVLPRLLTGEEIPRRDLDGLGVGGLCMNCKTCHYPVCAYGK